MDWIIPLGASIISIVFSISLFTQWSRNRKGYTFWYAISMVMFSIAVFAEFYAGLLGWSLSVYKIYYFFAISLVAFMGAGTVYLLAKKGWGHAFLAYALLGSTLFLIRLSTAPVDTALLAHTDITVGGAAILSDEARSYSIWLSAVGGVVLLVGAIYSWWRTRYAGHLFIALSALTMSLGGRLAKMDLPLFLPITELVGISLLYYGVIWLQRKHQQLYEKKRHLTE
jgi:hypothetical protein